MDDVTRIQSTIDRINRATLGGARVDIRDAFHERVVFASPDFRGRVSGRDACLATYAEFTTHSTVHEFKPGAPDVHVIGATAVATTPFDIRYTIEGRTTRESGHDLMVFAKDAGDWRVVWRTVVVHSSAEA